MYPIKQIMRSAHWSNGRRGPTQRWQDLSISIATSLLQATIFSWFLNSYNPAGFPDSAFDPLRKVLGSLTMLRKCQAEQLTFLEATSGILTRTRVFREGPFPDYMTFSFISLPWTARPQSTVLALLPSTGSAYSIIRNSVLSTSVYTTLSPHHVADLQFSF